MLHSETLTRQYALQRLCVSQLQIFYPFGKYECMHTTRKEEEVTKNNCRA